MIRKCTSRDQGISVTGGFMYRSTELTGLGGWYIYGDFGLDEQNELYICDFRGRIYRLVESEIAL